jgi:hypothetical protein
VFSLLFELDGRQARRAYDKTDTLVSTGEQAKGKV